MIAHRLSSLQAADRIAVLNNGRIAELGSHEALLLRNGVYSSLFRAQFDPRMRTFAEEEAQLTIA